jgi:hypothetical protein
MRKKRERARSEGKMAMELEINFKSAHKCSRERELIRKVRNIFALEKYFPIELFTAAFIIPRKKQQPLTEKICTAAAAVVIKRY